MNKTLTALCRARRTIRLIMKKDPNFYLAYVSNVACIIDDFRLGRRKADYYKRQECAIEIINRLFGYKLERK